MLLCPSTLCPSLEDTSTRSGDCFARNFIVDWRWLLESNLLHMLVVREGLDDWDNLGKCIQKFFPVMVGGKKNTLKKLNFATMKSAESVAKRIQLNHQYTFFQNVLQWQTQEWGYLMTPIRGN